MANIAETIMRADSSSLIELLTTTATERGILIASDAPQQELNVAQQKIDICHQELIRRLAW